MNLGLFKNKNDQEVKLEIFLLEEIGLYETFSYMRFIKKFATNKKLKDYVMKNYKIITLTKLGELQLALT